MTELNKTQILLVILILLVVGYIVLPKQPVTQGVSVQQMVDSLKVHDSVRNREINTLRIKYTQVTFQIDVIKRKIDSIPDKLKNTAQKYDTKRNHVNTLSPDEQVEFFSKWLSEEAD